MAEEQDQSQKTEEPTQKRIEDAVKKGQVAFSKEVTSFVLLVLITIFVIWISPVLLKTANFELADFVVQPHNVEVDYEGDDILRLAIKITMKLGLLMAIPLIIALVAAFAGSFLQNGLILSPEVFKFDISKISPVAGFKRIFSLRSVVEFLKGIFKLFLVGLAAYVAIQPELHFLKIVHELSFSGILDIMLDLVTKMLITICIVLGFIAGLDYFYQRFEYMKNLRMTKQEVKEELKQAEGNPEIKAKLRAIRMERARKRMIAEVPKADVIITNPTHYSVALKYESKKMPAPQVIAKGMDHIALQIREIAKEHRIPLIENKPLARALYDSVEVDDFIPYEHYKAVAEIITKVMNLKGKKKIN